MAGPDIILLVHLCHLGLLLFVLSRRDIAQAQFWSLLTVRNNNMIEQSNIS